ncbi:MAG: NADH-quinone oxidoreductase subunit D [Planctomycetota bacterium]
MKPELENYTDVSTQEMTINMGPQHPATHGVLRLVIKVDGEILTWADPDVGNLHRCAEKIAENLTYPQYIPYTDRLDYLASMNNNLGYCLSVEKLLALEIPERAQFIRTIVVELNRIASHLVAFGAYSLDIGAWTPLLYAFREREWILKLLEEISGARMTYSYMRIGGVSADIDANWIENCRNYLNEQEKRWEEYNRLLSFNKIFIKRTANITPVTPEDAIAYGLTGPCLRGSGVDFDLRRDFPYLVYDKLDFKVCLGCGEKGTLGDCWDRYWVRMLEIKESIKIVRQCLDMLPEGEILSKEVKKVIKPPAGEAYVRTENPKGEVGYYVVSDGSKQPYRVRVRAPSFNNLSPTARILPGWMLADAVAWIGSLDIVLGEVDR